MLKAFELPPGWCEFGGRRASRLGEPCAKNQQPAFCKTTLRQIECLKAFKFLPSSLAWLVGGLDESTRADCYTRFTYSEVLCGLKAFKF